MKQHAETATANFEVETACSHYLQQVRTTLPLDALTVVMLSPGEDTAKVVFSWRAASECVSPDNGSTSAVCSELEQQSVLNITLHGSDGPIGGVLLHTSVTEGFNQLHCRLARDLSFQLAMRLDNAQLHQRLRATSQEVSLQDEVSHIITSAAGLEEVFDRLATAMGKVVDFDLTWLSWIDSNGYDIRTLKFGTELPKAAGFEVTTPIVCCNEEIASLKVQRARTPFNASERGLLALVGNQIAPAVQYARYHHSVSGQSNGITPKADLTPSNRQAVQNLANNGPSSAVDLAHALCTPLTAIKGYASSLLQTDIEWPPEIQREFLKTIDQAADRLGEVIRDLLLAGTSEPGHTMCRCVPTNLQDLLGEIESKLLDEIPGAAVKFRCQPVTPTVAIDRRLIKQVIRRLIECSIDTTGQGGTIHVEARIGNEGPAISIASDKNYQTNQWAESLPPAKWDTDLRVVACRNILKAHGTALHIDTMQEGRLRFWFTLPKAAQIPDED